MAFGMKMLYYKSYPIVQNQTKSAHAEHPIYGLFA